MSRITEPGAELAPRGGFDQAPWVVKGLGGSDERKVTQTRSSGGNDRGDSASKESVVSLRLASGMRFFFMSDRCTNTYAQVFDMVEG